MSRNPYLIRSLFVAQEYVLYIYFDAESSAMMPLRLLCICLVSLFDRRLVFSDICVFAHYYFIYIIFYAVLFVFFPHCGRKDFGGRGNPVIENATSNIFFPYLFKELRRGNGEKQGRRRGRGVE